MAKGHETAGVGFPRVPGDLPRDYPEASPPGPAWTIYHYGERRSYWHFADPATWDEAIQRDYDPEGLTVAERQARGQRATTIIGVPGDRRRCWGFPRVGHEEGASGAKAGCFPL